VTSPPALATKNVSGPRVASATLAYSPIRLLPKLALEASPCAAVACAASRAKTKPELPAPVKESAKASGDVGAPELNSTSPVGLKIDSRRSVSVMLFKPLPGSRALNTTRRSLADVMPSESMLRVSVCDAAVMASPVITSASSPGARPTLPRPVRWKSSGPCRTSMAWADMTGKRRSSPAARQGVARGQRPRPS
jgi:hypothetical protein